MSKTYLALTIGPIYKTIQRARKTRELWAASFLLSQFMRRLLKYLEDGKFGEALSPDVSELSSGKTRHGAGIWNDNCYFKINDSQIDRLKNELPGIIAKAKQEIIGLALYELEREKKGLGFSRDELEKILAQHFHCHAVLVERPADASEPILQYLRKLTASAEMRDLYPTRHDDFVSQAMSRGVAVKGLYHLGFEETDSIFTYYKNRFDGFKTDRRMPSLLEIGLREFRSNKDLYSKIENIITEYSEDDAETDKENQEIIQLLKKQENAAGDSLFKKRHKYVAIVQSDGDGVGNLISGQTDEAEIKKISTALMAFSTAAVEKVVDFDGLPVYAGGDDLLFFAPLQNKNGDNIFKLLEDIQEVFKAQNLPADKTSLSFGVSVFYYKYPLSEALENGRELLNKLAKKLAFQRKNGTTAPPKNAVAFRVMLHAGQSFATVLQQDGDAWDYWKVLLIKHVQQDAAFVSGVVHTLERLGWLLEQSCVDGTTEAFFDHHFNEAKNSPRWPFVQAVRQLAEAIHRDYGQLFPPDNQGNPCIEPAAEKQFFTSHIHFQQDFWDGPSNTSENRRTEFRNNMLYAALRMIQFLNADDHE